MKTNRPSVGIGVFVWKDGKFLMGKRVSKHGKETWSVPGGYLEYGETFEEGAYREVLEETGVKIKNIKFMTTTNNIFPDEQKHTISIFMSGELDSGQPTTIEPDKFVEVGWFSFDNLPEPLFTAFQEFKKMKPEFFLANHKGRLAKNKPPSVNRIADLQQLIADFSSIQRALDIADKGRLENDAEHSFGLALTCWFIAPRIAPHLDMQKILKYALAHDIVELHAGDTFIMDTEGVKTKASREEAALKQLEKEWPDFPEMIQALKDYKDRANDEAEFVYIIDKMLPAILVNIGEKDKYWQRHKITREMHVENRRKAMKSSSAAAIYFDKLMEWLDNPNYYYKPGASDRS